MVLPGLCINVKTLTDESNASSVQREQHDWVWGRPFICACTSELRPPLEPGNCLSSSRNWECRGQRRQVAFPRSQADKVVVAAGWSRGSTLQLELDSHPLPPENLLPHLIGETEAAWTAWERTCGVSPLSPQLPAGPGAGFSAALWFAVPPIFAQSDVCRDQSSWGRTRSQQLFRNCH